MTAVDRLGAVPGAAVRAARRTTPWSVDALAGGVLLLLVLFVPDPEGPPADLTVPLPGVVLAGLTCAALVLRRRLPLPVLAATTLGAAGVDVLLDRRSPLAVAVVLALYTVAVHSERRTTLLAWAGSAAVLTSAGVAGGQPLLDEDVLSSLPWTAVAAALGLAVRNRRAYVAAVEERALRAEQSREEEARRQVAEERLHIARELHDVVAHRIAVVQVQAAVASHLLTSDPAAAREALGHVRRSGSEILDELSAILTVLRSPGDPVDPTSPAPGLGQLEALVASFSAAGLAVDWTLTGRPREVGAAVDLVAYRVLEEALTNAHKHGTGTARVVVDSGEQAVALHVSNEVRPAGRAGTGGHGLLGMQERAAAVGGVLQASRGPDGRFCVDALLPLQPTAIP